MHDTIFSVFLSCHIALCLLKKLATIDVHFFDGKALEVLSYAVTYFGFIIIGVVVWCRRKRFLFLQTRISSYPTLKLDGIISLFLVVYTKQTIVGFLVCVEAALGDPLLRTYHPIALPPLVKVIIRLTKSSYYRLCAGTAMNHLNFLY